MLRGNALVLSSSVWDVWPSQGTSVFRELVSLTSTVLVWCSFQKCRQHHHGATLRSSPHAAPPKQSHRAETLRRKRFQVLSEKELKLEIMWSRWLNRSLEVTTLLTGDTAGGDMCKTHTNCYSGLVLVELTYVACQIMRHWRLYWGFN